MSKHPWEYYAKVSAMSFIVGMAMEYFMIKTGFYEKTVEIEAIKILEDDTDGPSKKEIFFKELEKQLKEKNLKIPDTITQGKSQ